MKNDYPKQVYPDPPYHPPEYLAYLEKASHALKSVRLVVYSGMAAFILLAAYGFFMIFLLTSDARTMSEQTRRMATQMELISRDMGAMNATMSDMRANVGDMRASLIQMNRHMTAMRRLHGPYDSDRGADPALGAQSRFRALDLRWA